MLPPPSAHRRLRDRTPTLGLETDPTAKVPESLDWTAGAKSRKGAVGGVAGVVDASPRNTDGTCQKNIEREDAKEEMWLRKGTGTIEAKISITRLSTYLHFHFLLFLLFVFVRVLLLAGVIWLVNLGYTCIGPRIS